MDQLKTKLDELLAKARSDSSLSIQQFVSISQKAALLQQSLGGVREIPKSVLRESVETLGIIEKQISVVERIRKMRNPSYFDEFASTLARPPYALPGTLFNPQGNETVTIDIQNTTEYARFQEERSDFVLSVLFPGSFTYRYHGVPIKIMTGPWYSDLTARLRGIHTIGDEPIFAIERRGRQIPVFRPITVRAQRVFGDLFTCIICLSINGLDEGCNHSPKAKRPLKLPSASSIETRVELNRSDMEARQFLPPISLVIAGANYIKALKVGRAVLGFERRSTGRTTVIEYDPPLGLILETRGLSFRVEIPQSFSKHVSNDKTYLARDIFIQMMALFVSDLLTKHGIPAYQLETSLSGFITATELEAGQFSFDDAARKLTSGEWIDRAIQETIAEGGSYVERFDIDQDKLRALFIDLSTQDIDRTAFEKEIHHRLLHSLAHVLLIASCITSGSTFSDLQYLIEYERGEIVIFDSVNGGNGSSEMVFDFCTPADFTVGEVGDENAEGTLFQPKHFDEALAELLLPCQQGLAERLFHQDLFHPRYREIHRRSMALASQRPHYSREFAELSRRGVAETFPASIGFHVALAQKLHATEAERLKEALGICVHGCPDCLHLGNMCDAGGFAEKFEVSKDLLDEFFRFMTAEVTVPYDAGLESINQALGKNGVVILFGSSGAKRENGEKVHEEIRNRATELSGKNMGGKFVKFAGIWVDSPPNVAETQFRVMLRLV